VSDSSVPPTCAAVADQTCRHLARDPVMAALIEAVGNYGLRQRGTPSVFQALVRAIAHQQLHANAAGAILRRLETHFDGRAPSAAQLAGVPIAALRSIGFSSAKVAALQDLARCSLAGTVPEWPALAALSDAEIIEQLTRCRGIGRWTVQMLLIFELGRADVLPVDDFGVRNGFRLAYGLRKMPAPRALASFGERWAPYRSAAAWYLWRAVELERDGRLPRAAVRIRLPRVTRARSAEKRRTRLPITSSAAASAAPPRPAGAQTRARPRRAPRSRAPAKRK
jgi:DNA-3-methyladenine glycosylase II